MCSGRGAERELARLGCTYVQIDSPDLGTLVDPENRALRENLGMSTERTLTEGVDIINSVADVPGVTFGLHICKDNYESKWIASGGYEYTADKVFARSGNRCDQGPALGRMRRPLIRVGAMRTYTSRAPAAHGSRRVPSSRCFTPRSSVTLCA